MTLLLFLTGLTTTVSTGSSSSPTSPGEFAVSGGSVSDLFPVTAVSYTYAPTSRRTE